MRLPHAEALQIQAALRDGVALADEKSAAAINAGKFDAALHDAWYRACWALNVFNVYIINKIPPIPDLEIEVTLPTASTTISFPTTTKED